MNKINLETAPSEILQMIAASREKKDKTAETLKLVNSAINMLHDYIVTLYFERAHIYQLICMTERDRLYDGDSKKKTDALAKMKKYVAEAENYVLSNKLTRWFHRLYRFYGKVAEYKGDYKKAVSYYKKSLKFWKSDPEVVARGLPRNFELEGFLSSALIMSGDSEKGLKKAKIVYRKYETIKQGRQLKKKDYTTWAIWRTGCVIFVVRGVIEGKLKIDKKEILNWLTEAEKLLSPSKKVKLWADFQYRKDEIGALKKKLRAF